LFCQGQLEAGVGVNVTISEMVNDLADGPIAVGRVELPTIHPNNYFAQSRGGALDDGDQFIAARFAVVGLGDIFAGGILRRLHCFFFSRPLQVDEHLEALSPNADLSP